MTPTDKIQVTADGVTHEKSVKFCLRDTALPAYFFHRDTLNKLTEDGLLFYVPQTDLWIESASNQLDVSELYTALPIEQPKAPEWVVVPVNYCFEIEDPDEYRLERQSAIDIAVDRVLKASRVRIHWQSGVMEFKPSASVRYWTIVPNGCRSTFDFESLVLTALSHGIKVEVQE